MKIIPGRSKESGCCGVSLSVCLSLTSDCLSACLSGWLLPVRWVSGKRLVWSLIVFQFGAHSHMDTTQTRTFIFNKEQPSLLPHRLCSIFKPVHSVRSLNYDSGWLPPIFCFIGWYVNEGGWGQGLRLIIFPPLPPSHPLTPFKNLFDLPVRHVIDIKKQRLCISVRFCLFDWGEETKTAMCCYLRYFRLL